MCGKQFVISPDKTGLRKQLWNKYVWHKQTLKQLAEEYGKSLKWVQKQLDLVPAPSHRSAPQSIIAVADATFFKRGYGILIVRCPRLKKNLHWHEVASETALEYQRARQELESQGYVIEAAVIDGRRGILRVFSDIPVQLCQFHQIQIVRRYLTSRPKLPAGQELRAITLALPMLSEKVFAALLDEWFIKWEPFLKERTYAVDGQHWTHTHRRIRSAHRSLKTNLPHLFTYQKHPKLNIPNTTNSIDGYFSKLKRLLGAHSGMTIKHRYKVIQEILTT